MQSAIGLLGGSFNPIHIGHIAMAEAAVRALSLEQMILMPAGDPPHKPEGVADKWDRLAMARLACEGRFAVSAMEAERPGKTYTVDTLLALKEQFPGRPIVMLIGADTLREIAGWKDARRVFSLCTFAVFGRGDEAPGDVPFAVTTRMEAEIPDISATQIRTRVHAGLPLCGLVPPRVEDYIGQKRLYDPPKLLSREEMLERLSKTLSAKRFSHSLGVEQTMRKLAKRFGYDIERAALAGLLHDCAKNMPYEEMLAIIRETGLCVDDMRCASRELLHAPIGLQVARAAYGVTDPEILRTIYYHSTGHAPMEALDKLLCVADMSEPGRWISEAVGRVRKAAARDLDEAVIRTLQVKISHVRKQGKPLHPDTEAALRAVIARAHGRRQTRPDINGEGNA